MIHYGKFDSFEELRAAAEKELRCHIGRIKKRSAASKRYRIEHCLRVATIGRTVALASGLDPELLEIACLLHDIGKWDAQKPVDHGRSGALYAYAFLLKSGIKKSEAREVAQGIAMHTDGLCNPRKDAQGTKKNAEGKAYFIFDSEPSILAQSVGDCDNIDRFSAYRIADTLEHFTFMELSNAKQIAWIKRYLASLKDYRRYVCATDEAQRQWIANLAFQEEFFQHLLGDVQRADIKDIN